MVFGGGNMRVAFASILVSALLAPAAALADDNLRVCLDGRYPALCDNSKLTPTQREQAVAAVRKANLRTCLDGRYPALCNHLLLSPTEQENVGKAEARENLKVCLAGKYPALCKHDLLTDAQRTQVFQAESRENLSICLAGKYPKLCRHEQLTQEQLEKTQAAEQVHARQAPSSRRVVRASGGSCESGHWIADVMSDGEIIKLEDGSLWEVDGADTVDSALWLPTTEVVICDDKIINTDDNETVHATQIR